MERSSERVDERLVKIVVFVDLDVRETVRTKSYHDAFSRETGGLVGCAGVGHNHNAVRTCHAPIVDTELVVSTFEAFDNRVDPDKVFDMVMLVWSC